MPATSHAAGASSARSARRAGRVAVEVDHGVPVRAAQHLADVEVAVDREDQRRRRRRPGRPAPPRSAGGAASAGRATPGSCGSVSRTARSRAASASSACCRASAGGQPGRRVVGQRQVHPADDLAEVGREVLGRAGLDAERPARLGDRPGPAVLGAGEVGLRDGDRDPVPRVSGSRHSTSPHRAGDSANPAAASRRRRAARRVRPGQRLGHPLHDDLPADDPRLVGLVDAPSPARRAASRATGRRLAERLIRNPSAGPRRRRTAAATRATRRAVARPRHGATPPSSSTNGAARRAVAGRDHADRVGRAEGQQVSLRHGAPGRPAR